MRPAQMRGSFSYRYIPYKLAPKRKNTPFFAFSDFANGGPFCPRAPLKLKLYAKRLCFLRRSFIKGKKYIGLKRKPADLNFFLLA